MQKMKKIISLMIAGIFLMNLASCLTINSVRTSPSEIEPGEDATIRMNIENNLGRDIEDIAVSLDLSEVPFAPYQSGTSKVLSEIKEDRDKEASFRIIALENAKSGTYKIPVAITYENKSKTSYISLIVNSEPSLKIEYEGLLIKGKKNKINVKIINTGLSDVKLLSMVINNGAGAKILGSKYIYIGDIDSDDFDSGEFEIFISETANSMTSLPVKLEYRDALNKFHEENTDLVLRAYSTEEAVKLGLIKKSYAGKIIFGVVIFIILYITYRKIKRRIKKKEKRSRDKQRV